MNKLIKSACIAGLVAATLTGCSDAKWKLSGNIADADGQDLILENMSSIGWTPVDTVKLDAKGDFKFSQPAPAAPDIYRLRLNGQTAYFPIDSIESVTLTASAKDFSTGYRLAGNDNARMMMMADSIINASIAEKGEALTITDPELKRELGKIILVNPGSVVAYYIVSKTIGNAPLFNPSEKIDHRLIGAVANAMNIERPEDPRTIYLKDKFLRNRQLTSVAQVADTLVADVTTLFEINRHNATGANVSLRDVASKGDVVILNFTSLTHPESIEYNVALNKVYDAYKNRGVQIYQVSLDEDEVEWRAAAKNLPWICVYNPPTYTDALMQYNVGVLPTTFIIDRKGELVDRVTDIDKLAAQVNKYL
ncbi:MAG: AhpC/TSA family protein [Barnesiella sp.]|nr:AhpC/TSA family protein [Bacteroidales bacterium]MBD5248525.1 AhpC/TSA family protein [Barnesiella sp.]